MASLLALLAQQQPNLQTRKGLILLGLQNDFLSPDGKLPVSTKSGFLDRIKELVPSFRDFGDIIWVASEFEASREPNVADENGDTVIAGTYESLSDGPPTRQGSKRKASHDARAPIKRVKAADVEDDPELFLTRTTTREPCCLRGSWGAEYPAELKTVIDRKDLQVVKTFYSAFGSTSLLLTLRSRLITELFVCGCNTNLSVFATSMDAARYGIRITLIEDCLGFRRKERHDEAIRQLVDIMEADVVTSAKVIDVLKNHPEDAVDHDDDDESEGAEEESEDEQASPHRKDSKEDADLGLLAADSEEEDDELELPSVGSPHFPAQGLTLRYASSMGSRSRLVASHSPGTPSAEHTQPSKPRATIPAKSTSAGAGTPEHPSTKSSDLPQRANTFEREVKASRSVAPGCHSASRDDDDSCQDSEALTPATDVGDRARDTHDLSRADATDSQVNQSGHSSNLPPSSIALPPTTHREAYAQLSPATVEPDKVAMEAENDDNTDAAGSRSTPLFGEEKEEESAGSRILFDLLPDHLAEDVFEQLSKEINWQRMTHQTGEVPRLVCCEGEFASDGSTPLYRHPSDQTLPLQQWTPTVEKVLKAAEKAVGHSLNHVLIQLYRTGNDYISEHSDKTLDIVKGSKIVNVSFGAQRTMRLRTKRGAGGQSTASKDSASSPPPQRTTYRVPMPHNSMITMSLETNAEYLHGINADKRPAVEFIEAEKAYGGQRISLTFRDIGTFLSADEKMIWGQGAVGKTKEEARPVTNGDPVESERLVRAFGVENQASSIDWDAVYGQGSDVLHLKLKHV